MPLDSLKNCQMYGCKIVKILVLVWLQLLFIKLTSKSIFRLDAFMFKIYAPESFNFLEFGDHLSVLPTFLLCLNISGCGFDTQPSQTIWIFICCFLVKHTALRRKQIPGHLQARIMCVRRHAFLLTWNIPICACLVHSRIYFIHYHLIICSKPEYAGQFFHRNHSTLRSSSLYLQM